MIICVGALASMVLIGPNSTPNITRKLSCRVVRDKTNIASGITFMHGPGNFVAVNRFTALFKTQTAGNRTLKPDKFRLAKRSTYCSCCLAISQTL